METFKIGICEPDGFSDIAILKLKTLGEVSLFNGADLKSFICDKNAIFVRLKYSIDNELLSYAKKLQYICSPTTGLNHIKASTPRIEIVSLKGEYGFLDTIRATPEHVFGLTLALLRNYSHAFLNENNTLFDRNPYRGYELFKNKVGIIGLGRVGKIIARYFSAFDAVVYYYDIEPRNSNHAKCCNSVEELIEKATIIILCANYLPENEKIIDSSHFQMMRGKYFVNAARGELVNESELLNYLEKDWFKGVAIDVISNETAESEFLNKAIPLTRNINLVITPHIGGATFSSMMKVEEFIAEKLLTKIIGCK